MWIHVKCQLKTIKGLNGTEMNISRYLLFNQNAYIHCEAYVQIISEEGHSFRKYDRLGGLLKS